MDENDTTESCSSCLYGLRNGKCHRYPPKIVLVGLELMSEYPDVSGGDWCGEYRRGKAMQLPWGVIRE